MDGEAGFAASGGAHYHENLLLLVFGDGGGDAALAAAAAGEGKMVEGDFRGGIERGGRGSDWRIRECHKDYSIKIPSLCFSTLLGGGSPYKFVCFPGPTPPVLFFIFYFFKYHLERYLKCVG